MSILKKRDDDEQVDPLHDIVEGVDIIGTMINDMLPQIAEDITDLRRRIDDLAESDLPRLSASADDSAGVADVSERLELLEQRFLAHEQTSLDRHSDLRDEINELMMSLADLHNKIDSLLESQQDNRID
jgi:hypothetical protein